MLLKKIDDKNYISQAPTPIGCQIAAEDYFDFNPVHKTSAKKKQVVSADYLFKKWLNLSYEIESLRGTHIIKLDKLLKPGKLFFSSPKGIFDNNGNKILTIEKTEIKNSLTMSISDFDSLPSHESSIVEHYGFISGDLNYLVPDLLEKISLILTKNSNPYYAGSRIDFIQGVDITQGLKRKFINNSYDIKGEGKKIRATLNFEYALFSKNQKNQVGSIEKSLLVSNLMRVPFL